MTSLFFIFAASGAPTSEAPDMKSVDAMKQFKIVPDAIADLPATPLSVNYGNLSVDMGNELTPTQVHMPPEVFWPTENNTFYTLMMLDLDHPESKTKQNLHWLVLNIPGSDVSKGVAVYDYVGSAPGEGTGFHRYVFLAYKQPKEIEDRVYEDMQNGDYESRQFFSSQDLTKALNLDALAAGNFYRAQYDSNVPQYTQENTPRMSESKIIRY